MREVGDNLHVFSEPEGTDLVEHQGKEHKAGEEQDILHETDDQGVGQYLCKRRAGEDHLKVFEPDKRPVSPCPELEESKAHVDDRQHPEQDEIEQGGEEQQVEHPLRLYLFQQFLAFHTFSLLGNQKIHQGCMLLRPIHIPIPTRAGTDRTAIRDLDAQGRFKEVDAQQLPRSKLIAGVQGSLTQHPALNDPTVGSKVIEEEIEGNEKRAAVLAAEHPGQFIQSCHWSLPVPTTAKGRGRWVNRHPSDDRH
ncbi:hypothetical protein SDC9_94927 [bioreactor metagenome]|uniref:Uncharacterized protein n=1 Tax=bioreactor metagenome TaxID=1076179 RepID=A0A645ABI4_9ZZZZ